MNQFLKCEKIGRDLFKELLDQIEVDWQKEAEGDYNPVDYYFSRNGKVSVVEIKVRDIIYKDYPTHLMEFDKLKSLLLDKKNTKSNRALYACFFGTEEVYFYNALMIAKVAKLGTIWTSRTTVDYSDKVAKDVLYIPTNIALRYKKINNIWTKQN